MNGREKEQISEMGNKHLPHERIAVFSELIDTIPLGVFRVSPDRGYPITYANRTLALMSGYDISTEIIGRSSREFLPPSPNRSRLVNELLTNGAIRNHEINFRRRDGSEIWVAITAKAEYAPDKSIAYIEGFCEDMTERRVIETEMQYHDAEMIRYALALNQANRKLNLLQSITRHDILNQLTPLGIYLELMKESITDPVILGYISIGQKVTETISRQMQFTKDYQDIGVVSPQWFDVEKTIRDATGSLPLENLALSVNVAGLMVYADPLFEKVFYNLVDNALRHAQSMSQIRFSQYPKGEMMIIRCEDDGCGVPAKHKEGIFKREHFKHTGFGLYLSREILGITGISIQENGEPGKGARFDITVPRDFFRISPTT